jgi:hypothetical protein
MVLRAVRERVFPSTLAAEGDAVKRWLALAGAVLVVVVATGCDRSSGRGGVGAAGLTGPTGPRGLQGPRGLPGRAAEPGMSNFPQGIFDVTDFGAQGDGVADDTAAIQATIEAAAEVGGGVVFFPPGTYPIGQSLQIGARNNIAFNGSGIDATILTSTSPTEPIFDSGFQSLFRLWQDMTLTSSVTKTAGPLMYFQQEIRSTFRRIKLTGHMDGIQLDAFEAVLIDNIFISEPSAPGTAIIAGKPANGPQGADLSINNAILRGGDEPLGNGPNITSLYGLTIFDADAVFTFNANIAGFRRSALRIEPQTRAFNHHFVQSFFDATAEGPSVDVGGPGAKQQITFTGTWIASAGQIDGFNPAKVRNSVGLRLRNEGTYGPWNITGGRVYNTLGRGIEVLTTSIPLAISGVTFETFGTANMPGANEALFVATGVNQPSVNVSGCTFYRGGGGANVQTTGTANLFTISASYGEGRINCGTRPLLSQANAFLGGVAGCN